MMIGCIERRGGDMDAYQIGIMKTVVEAPPSGFNEMLDAAVEQLKALLPEDIRTQIALFQFQGPHLIPSGGTYAPLDFLQIGLRAKLERDIPFLLIITEVELTPSTAPYVLALPSQLTNVSVISTKRLSPAFWGGESDPALTRDRLTALMAHSLGHMLNLPHSDDPRNIMYDFPAVEALDAMQVLTEAQTERLRHYLPIEAREKVAEKHRARFAAHQIWVNIPAIGRAVWRVNPLRMLWQLPTMLTASFSVIIVLFFAPEIWDVASTLSTFSMALFSLIAIVSTTMVLYRAFSIGPVRERTGGLSESTVVTGAAAVLSVFLTVFLLYTILLLMVFVSAVTFFPERLKETWPTADPAVGILEQLKLGMFVGAMGVITGSLGGGAGNKQLIRLVMFIDEES
jgi:hypothetical protein